MVRDREEELESIKYAIAKQELVQEKFDEKKIMYFLSKVPKGDRADINYYAAHSEYLHQLCICL